MIAGSVKNTIRFCWEAGKGIGTFMQAIVYEYSHISINVLILHGYILS